MRRRFSPGVAALLAVFLVGIGIRQQAVLGELEHGPAHDSQRSAVHTVRLDDGECPPLAHWHAATERACGPCLACLQEAQTPFAARPTVLAPPAGESGASGPPPAPPTDLRRGGFARGRAPPA